MSDEAPPTNATIEMIVDAAAPDDGKMPCPECGKRYVPGPGMGVHRHSAHGWVGTKAKTRGRLRGGPPPSNVARGPGRPPKIDLTVDDIFDVIVNQMFPRGSIPVAALTPLLRWRHATDEMLIEVLHGGKE